MEEETIDKICHSLDAANHYAMVIFSVLFIGFGVAYAILSFVRGYNAVVSICFGVIAYVGYKLMFRTALAELRDFKKK